MLFDTVITTLEASSDVFVILICPFLTLHTFISFPLVDFYPFDVMEL